MKWHRNGVSGLFCDLFRDMRYSHTGLPAIVIFTKFDKLVTNAMMAAGDAIAHLQDEEIWQYTKRKAFEDAEHLCIRPWKEAVGKVPLMVSSG